MSKLAMMVLCLVLLPYQGAHGQGQDSSRTSQNSTQAVDSQAVRFMPMMWMHLDSMGRWSPAHMQQMMATHQRMAGQDDADDGTRPHDGARHDGPGHGNGSGIALDSPP